jgi:hypothetical protein
VWGTRGLDYAGADAGIRRVCVGGAICENTYDWRKVE